MKKKVLVIRFSSIGDIVLTTPVLRCIKSQLSEVELHYVTKQQYFPLLKANPYLDKIYTFSKNINEIIPQMKAEKYDYIIDLHKNIRSLILKSNLSGKKISFRKLNLQKWLLVSFRINLMPQIHIVDRYLETVKFLGVTNDGKGLDYFIPEDEILNLDEIPVIHRDGYIALAIGSIHETKQLPIDKLIAVCKKLNKPVILLGGPEDKEKGDIIREAIGDKIFNACGKMSLNSSASLVKNAHKVLANDTGLMHIAAAFRKNIISVWGNTVPEFGMYPYLPDGEKNKSVIFEVKGLSCRPCSKLGYEKCPKGHFNCMNMIDESAIADEINK